MKIVWQREEGTGRRDEKIKGTMTVLIGEDKETERGEGCGTMKRTGR